MWILGVGYHCFRHAFSRIIVFVSFLSALSQQENGVPQGSVLSVTLFAIMINGMVSAVGLSVLTSLFIDDSTVYYSSQSMVIIGPHYRSLSIICCVGLCKTDFPSVQQRPSAYTCRVMVYILPSICSLTTGLPFAPSVKFPGLLLGSKLSGEPVVFICNGSFTQKVITSDRHSIICLYVLK
jgi:hypothetical protein